MDTRLGRLLTVGFVVLAIAGGIAYGVLSSRINEATERQANTEVYLVNLEQVVTASKRIENATCCCGGETVDCDCCDDGVGPFLMPITFAGVVNNSCEDCDDWNVTHQIPPDIATCGWGAHTPGGTNGYTANEVASIPCDGEIVLTITCAGDDVIVGLTVYETAVMVASFTKTYADVSSIDCDNIGDLPPVFRATNNCNWTAATARLN